VAPAVLPIHHHLTITLDRPGASDLDLTRQANSVQWTTVVPGGFGSATLTFPGDRRRDLPHLAVLRILHDQRVLFEGRIEKPVVELSGSGWTTQIQAFGRQRLLDETSIQRLWVMGVRQIAETTIPVGNDPDGGALVDGFRGMKGAAGNFNPANPAVFGMMVQSADFSAANTGSAYWVGGRILAPAGVRFTRLDGFITGNALGAGTSYRALVQTTPDGVSFFNDYQSIGSTNASQAGGKHAQIWSEGFTIPLTASCMELRVGFECMIAAGPFLTTAAFYGLRIYGTSLTPDSGSTYYGGSILTDLVGQIPGLAVGVIETGSDFGIPEIERSVRSDARSVVDEVAGYYRREWAVWEDGRFDWKTPPLDEVQWVALCRELSGFKIQTDTDTLAKTTYITYTDADNQLPNEANAASTSDANPYVKTGQTKDVVVNSPTILTSTTAAQLATKLNTDSGMRPISSATISIPGSARIRRPNGTNLPAYMIRAGENIVIPDAPSTKPFAQGRDGETLFHIISTSADSATGTVTLECDGYQPAGDILLARLAAATRTVTG
jgi:hypothetical protein